MSLVAVPLGIIIALVFANALFVAAEFAIVGAPRASIEHQASEGGRLARRVARILDNPRLQDRYIATTQIGISVASLGLGMYGEHEVAGWIAPWLEPLDIGQWLTTHTAAVVVAVAVLTYVHIVFGEMVPKALALQGAERTALYLSPGINVLELLLRPFVVALNATGTGLLALIGIRREEIESERLHTSEELELIIKESQEGGMLRGESGRILRELFEFGDLTAGQVMVPRVQLVGIPVGMEVDELRQLVRASAHTRYPVYAESLDQIIGSIHIKALLRHFIANRAVTAKDARPLPYVPMTMPLSDVLAAMRRQRAQMAVVMDEQGGTAGLVTIEDLFEEVVGEIEEGRGRTPIVRMAPGRVRARGTVRLTEVGDALGVPLEHPDVQTVSGVVLAQLGRPPVVGDVVRWKGASFEVTAVAGRGVVDAVITRIGGA
jgi:CBS domain containing-hemolysin-like protein